MRSTALSSQGLDVVRQPLVEHEETTGGQVERPLEGSHPDVATDSVDGDPPLRPVVRNTRLRLEGDQHDAEVVVLRERLGVLAACRPRFSLELVDLSSEIELQEGAAIVCGCGRRR